jgi:putative hemolysin
MILVHILIITACMAASAFFAGIETGIVSIHRLRLRHFVRQGSRSARILESFVNNFDRLIGTTLVGTNMSLVVISVSAASIADNFAVPGAEAASSLITSVLVIIFGEFIPKAWFQARPIERSQRFATTLRAAEWLFRPVSIPIIGLARALTPGNRDMTFSRPAPFVTRDDLKILAREGEKDGVLSPKERYMIHRVIELSATKTSSIMIPRDKITAVFDDLPVPEFFALARQTGLTRFPCIHRPTGEFTGIVNVFYVLAAGDSALQKTVNAFIRPPLFIPAAMPADRVLPQMRRGRQPMCLVRDGDNVVGLVTTEDILRIIVGKL